MGREARARRLAGAEPRGLPDVPQLSERRLVKEEIDAVRKTGKMPRISFSDRAYVLDDHGQLRRTVLPVAEPAATITLREMPPVAI